MKRNPLLQCVITMPDGVVSTRDFVQTVNLGSNDMNLSVTSGNTIIFDSFSPEAEVRKRNVRNNNVSKLNQIPNRFSTEFYVGLRASSVTAILCSNTVQDYKVIDKKSGAALTATDKRPEYIKAAQGAKRPRPAEEVAAPTMMSTNMLVYPGVFGHPGLPRCGLFTPTPPPPSKEKIFDTSEDGLGALRRVVALEPSIMNFTSVPVSSPRDVMASDEEEEDDNAPKQFPFEVKNPVTEQQQPIYAENEFPDVSQTSDSLLRTAMTIADILNTPPICSLPPAAIACTLDAEENNHKDAAQTLLNLDSLGAKSRNPPGKG